MRGVCVSIDDLIAKYEAKCALLADLQALVDGAAICEEVVHDLWKVASVIEEAPLTLKEAAQESGYSLDHLARLIRQGKLPNVGRARAPRIPRRALPRRPTSSVAATRSGGYDPATDARSLVSRRKGGAHGSSQDSS